MPYHYEELIEIDTQFTGGSERARILASAMARTGALERGIFTLTSGGISDWYFDARRLMMDPAAALLIGRYFATRLLSDQTAQSSEGASAVTDGDGEKPEMARRVRAVGGIATGAIPLVSATIIASCELLVDDYNKVATTDNKPRFRNGQTSLAGFYVHKYQRLGDASHVNQLIAGAFPEDPSVPVAVVEDVVTTGGSVLKAIDVVEARGNPIAAVLCILDRDEGGAERLRERGYELIPLMRALPQARTDREDARVKRASNAIEDQIESYESVKRQFTREGPGE